MLKLSKIKVSSSSINKKGRLLTITASDKSPNDPPGNNLSPQVSWNPVSGATVYAVIMFDETVNILHWQVITASNSLDQGKYSDESIYIGARPPINGGRHNYQIEVFALRRIPDNVVGKIGMNNNFNAIVKNLDIANRSSGNIVAIGSIIGTYEHGDNNNYSKRTN